MIETYEGGRMVVDGQEHQRDLKIIGDRVKGEWWRQNDHELIPEDVEDILAASPESVVVGTGYAGNMRLADSLRSAFQERRIRLIAEKTPEAVKRFNELSEKGEDVAGAFHLTC